MAVFSNGSDTVAVRMMIVVVVAVARFIVAAMPRHLLRLRVHNDVVRSSSRRLHGMFAAISGARRGGARWGWLLLAALTGEFISSRRRRRSGSLGKSVLRLSRTGGY
jgi:hypothetical protein